MPSRKYVERWEGRLRKIKISNKEKSVTYHRRKRKREDEDF